MKSSIQSDRSARLFAQGDNAFLACIGLSILSPSVGMMAYYSFEIHPALMIVLALIAVALAYAAVRQKRKGSRLHGEACMEFNRKLELNDCDA